MLCAGNPSKIKNPHTAVATPATTRLQVPAKALLKMGINKFNITNKWAVGNTKLRIRLEDGRGPGGPSGNVGEKVPNRDREHLSRNSQCYLKRCKIANSPKEYRQMRKRNTFLFMFFANFCYKMHMAGRV